jgi:predicted ABC-type ATPase
MIELMAEAVRGGVSFAFETMLAGRNYARAIPDWRASGYRVTLHFLSLASPEIAIARVAERVRQGGHAIPDHVIRLAKRNLCPLRAQCVWSLVTM